MSTYGCAWCSALVGSQSRQAHFLCQQFLLPPASPTDTSCIRLTRSLQLHSCMPSWRHVSITVMQCSPWHHIWQRTSFSACCMPLKCSSAIPGNMTKDCHDWCTRIYTGLTFLSESVTNFVYWHIDVSSGRLHCTCRTTVHQYPKLLHDSTCIQSLVTGWWFRDIGSARTAIWHSLSLARWPSKLCPMSCATPPSTQQLSDF